MFLTVKKPPKAVTNISTVVITKESLQEMRSQICLSATEVVQTLVGMSCIWTKVKGKGKGSVHPITGHEGPEVEQRYSLTLSLTSALDGGWSRPRPGRFTAGKDPDPLYRRLGGPQGRSGRVRKILPSPGFDPRTVQPVFKKLFRI